VPTLITNDPATISDLNIVVGNIILVALQFFGIAFFIMVMVGGFKYLTAGDDKGKLQSATKTLTAAIGGIVFVILSYLLLQFLADFTGADKVTTFDITRWDI